MARSKKTKPRFVKPVENPMQPVIVDAGQFGRLLDRIEGRVFDALQSYGVVLGGTPWAGVESVPDTLGRLALDLRVIRHALSTGQKVAVSR